MPKAWLRRLSSPCNPTNSELNPAGFYNPTRPAHVVNPAGYNPTMPLNAANPQQGLGYNPTHAAAPQQGYNPTRPANTPGDRVRNLEGCPDLTSDGLPSEFEQPCELGSKCHYIIPNSIGGLNRLSCICSDSDKFECSIAAEPKVLS